MEYFPVDNTRVIYTKGLNSQKMNMRGMGCALYIHQKERQKSLGCVLYITARYLPENTVYCQHKCLNVEAEGITILQMVGTSHPATQHNILAS
jgi:hypothetical protein